MAPRLITLGDFKVGKTSLVNSFLTEISVKPLPNVGAQRVRIEFEGIEMRIEDTGGLEEHGALSANYLRSTQACVLVYDITSSDSYEKAKAYMSELESSATKPVIALVGNKTDLEEKRAVLTHDARAYADEKQVMFFETSATRTDNITVIFTEIARKLAADMEPGYEWVDDEDYQI